MNYLISWIQNDRYVIEEDLTSLSIWGDAPLSTLLLIYLEAGNKT